MNKCIDSINQANKEIDSSQPRVKLANLKTKLLSPNITNYELTQFGPSTNPDRSIRFHRLI